MNDLNKVKPTKIRKRIGSWSTDWAAGSLHCLVLSLLPGLHVVWPLSSGWASAWLWPGYTRLHPWLGSTLKLHHSFSLPSPKFLRNSKHHLNFCSICLLVYTQHISPKCGLPLKVYQVWSMLLLCCCWCEPTARWLMEFLQYIRGSYCISLGKPWAYWVQYRDRRDIRQLISYSLPRPELFRGARLLD